MVEVQASEIKASDLPPAHSASSCKACIPIVFECPAFHDIRLGFRHLFDDSHGAMRLFMWHPCQKEVASCLLQLLDGIDETLT